MQIKGILARFLPLCNVTICILGLMLCLQTFADYERSAKAANQKLDEAFLYCHCKKEMFDGVEYNNGDLSRINADNTLTKVSQDKLDENIKEFIEKNSDKVKIFCFVSKPGDNDYQWTEKKLDDIKKAWDIDDKTRRLTRLINIPLEFKNKTEEKP